MPGRTSLECKAVLSNGVQFGSAFRETSMVFLRILVSALNRNFRQTWCTISTAMLDATSRPAMKSNISRSSNYPVRIRSDTKYVGTTVVLAEKTDCIECPSGTCYTRAAMSTTLLQQKRPTTYFSQHKSNVLKLFLYELM